MTDGLHLAQTAFSPNRGWPGQSTAGRLCAEPSETDARTNAAAATVSKSAVRMRFPQGGCLLGMPETVGTNSYLAAGCQFGAAAPAPPASKGRAMAERGPNRDFLGARRGELA